MSNELEVNEDSTAAKIGSVAKVGKGAIQWSGGGWFGGVIGSSVWMLVVACFVASFGQVVLTFLIIAGFIISIVGGIAIWRQRDRIYPFDGMMIYSGTT